MKSILEAEIKEGQKILVRTDWNTPITNGEVKGARIDASLPTLNHVHDQGGVSIVISHFGREGESLKPIFDYFIEKYAQKFNNISFIKDPFTNESKEQILSAKNGDVIVIENIRLWKEEEENDLDFAKNIAGLAEIYVNDAFSASHREHASIVGLPKFLPSFAGVRFLEEYNHIKEVFNPPHPFLFILGGAKFETKIKTVEALINKADWIFIGGANAKKASELEIAKSSNIFFPIGDIEALDINDETVLMLEQKINESEFVLWNGPLGNYENGYTEGTKKIATILGNSKAKVLVGGGDTETAIDELGLAHKFDFISLAGGAMLDFIANGTLSGIDALTR